MTTERSYNLSNQEIRKYLPHRYPFLMIDRVLEIDHKGPLESLLQKDKIGTRVVGLKNVTYNEPYFPGHFPNLPIMPGVLVIESLAQASSFTIYPTMTHGLHKDSKDFHCVLAGVDSCRFRQPVLPGDTLLLETVLTNGKGPLWYFDCEAKIDGKKVAEAKIVAKFGFGSFLGSDKE